MKEWILSVFCIVFICALINMIIPDGRLNKYIKHTFAILVTLVVIKPFLSLDVNFDVFNDILSNEKVQYQTSYIDYLCKKKIDALEIECENIFSSYGVSNSTVELEFEINESVLVIKNATVNLCNSVINSNKEHIDIIGQAKKSVAQYLKLQEKDIRIYE